MFITGITEVTPLKSKQYLIARTAGDILLLLNSYGNKIAAEKILNKLRSNN